MTLKPLFSCSIIAVSVFSASHAFANQKPEFSVTATHIYNSSTTLDGTNTELKRDTWMLSADSSFQIAPKWQLGISVGYENENYDWSTISTQPTGLIAPSIAPWDKVKTIKASVSISHFLNRHWILTATPVIQSSYTDGLSMSDAHSYGLVTSGLYRFESGNMVGIGLAYLNDLNRVKTYPYLAISWKINDKWSLR